MPLAQLSPVSIQADPSQVNPLAKMEQNASQAYAAQAAQKTIKVAKTDTVTISKQALKMAGNDNSEAQETSEGESNQAAEKPKGKK